MATITLRVDERVREQPAQSAADTVKQAIAQAEAGDATTIPVDATGAGADGDGSSGQTGDTDDESGDGAQKRRRGL